MEKRLKNRLFLSKITQQNALSPNLIRRKLLKTIILTMMIMYKRKNRQKRHTITWQKKSFKLKNLSLLKSRTILLMNRLMLILLKMKSEKNLKISSRKKSRRL